MLKLPCFKASIKIPLGHLYFIFTSHFSLFAYSQMTLGKLVFLIRDESKRMIINVNGRSEMGGVGVSVCA